MLNKFLEENQCSLNMAIAWSVNAKNSLQNVHRFSPFELAIGQNPLLLYAATDMLSALSPMQASEITQQHLNNIYKAREAFTVSENSKKIHGSLSHNVQTSNNIFVTGGSVYYKQACDRRWRGSAKVLGRDGQQVLVKYGGIYV